MDVADPVCEREGGSQRARAARDPPQTMKCFAMMKIQVFFFSTLRLTDHALQSPHCTGINTLRTLRRFFTFSSVVQKKRHTVY